MSEKKSIWHKYPDEKPNVSEDTDFLVISKVGFNGNYQYFKFVATYCPQYSTFVSSIGNVIYFTELPDFPEFL